MLPIYYVLTVEKDVVLVHVEVNGVPVVRWNTPGQVSRTDQLNAWLEGGEVPVRVRIDWPRDDRDFQPGVAAAKVKIEPVAKDQSRGAPLLDFSWPPDDPDEERYPVEKTFTIRIDNPPPSEFWAKAKSIRLTPHERERAIGVVEELHQALSQRRREDALKLLMWKALDLRRAHYLDETQARGDLSDYLGFFLDSPDWKIAPLNKEELELHALARDRLIWITDAEGRDPIRSADGVQPAVRIPLYLAPVEDQWRIVR